MRIDKLNPSSDTQINQNPVASQSQSMQPQKVVDSIEQSRGVDAGGVLAQKADPRTQVDNRMQINAMADRGLRAERMEFGSKIASVVLHDFDDKSQDTLVDWLEGQATEVDDLVWAASRVRSSMGDKKANKLQTFFNDRGVRLNRHDKISAHRTSIYLDRSAFSTDLQAMIQKGDVDKSSARSIANRLKDVADPGDLFWAHWQLRKAERQGKLNFEDSNSRQVAWAPLSAKLDGRANMRELNYELVGLRKNGFTDHEGLNRLVTLLRSSKKDTNAIAFAERAFNRQMKQARNKAKDSPAELTHLDAVSARMKEVFSDELRGRYSSYAVNQNLAAMRRKGLINTDKEYYALKAFAGTSQTMEEFATGVMSVHMQLRMITLNAELMDAWEEFSENYQKASSGDTYAADGTLLETSSERALKENMAERLVDEVNIRTEVIEFLATRALSLGRKSTALSAMGRSQNPSQAREAQAAFAVAQSEYTDLDRPG
ncbi:hypothetical protein KAI87_04130 [Myxococcota bacterium]|nr:hypothetical protein [Myxococcota bacterium]